jgi:DNA-binding GntR family transcriptional regulator
MASVSSHLSVSVQRLTDAAYQALKNLILAKTLTPGQRLNVDDLAGQLGMSRTPVKDALNALATEGLVEILPRRGTFVAGLAPEEIAEVFELRRALELLAAELLIARITDEDLRRLRRHLSDLDEATAGGDVDDHMRHNLAFHQLFVNLAGNRKLTELYEGLNVHIQIARIHARAGDWQQRRAQEQAEHRAIMEALEARDAQRLMEAVNAHIRRAKQSLADDLQKEVGDRLTRTNIPVPQER